VSFSPMKVIIIGLGNAGQEHAKALEHIPNVNVIAGIDLDQSRKLTFRKCDLPIYSGVFDAASEKLDPNIIVVATPTRSHPEVCANVAEYFRTVAILVEKPAADNLGDALRIVEGVAGKQPVDVAYHMAFSPEVEWALEKARAGADALGPPIAIEAWSADPYQSQLASAQARLGSSWIDSGINALSVIERFAKPIERTSLRSIGSAFEGQFICEAGGKNFPAVVLTSWHSTAPTRTTRIRYSSGADVVMDHHGVAGYVVENGAVSDFFGSDGTVLRREAHYKALYQSWLVDGSQIFSTDTSSRLHRLLLDGIK
jgi:predicted dehydrogenase